MGPVGSISFSSNSGLQPRGCILRGRNSRDPSRVMAAIQAASPNRHGCRPWLFITGAAGRSTMPAAANAVSG
ncbi:hypothetical protein L484_026935 [Morus notabilis]|uniref:Uncharacterized protein n=1 Tax=Morus notabilis TaxID=981085 RepID=W9R183_9ROSA|nr:hypothetical protein L484_026935 [Morus notabilis]